MNDRTVIGFVIAGDVSDVAVDAITDFFAHHGFDRERVERANDPGIGPNVALGFSGAGDVADVPGAVSNMTAVFDEHLIGCRIAGAVVS